MWTGLCFLLLTHIATGLPPSPCPDLYGYDKDEFGEVKGLIALLAPPRYSQAMIVVTLSSPVPVAQNQVGQLILKGGQVAAQEAARQVLMGRRHVLQFQITFPPGKPVPTLLNIMVNGKDFCTARTVPADSRARITLHSFINTGTNAPPTTDFALVTGFFPQDMNLAGQDTREPPPSAPEVQTDYMEYFTQFFSPNMETTIRPAPPPTTTRRTTTVQQNTFLEEDSPQDFEADPFNCGVAESLANSLVVFGTDADRGEWPWHVAIFKNTYIDSSTGISFQCGGTLVTRKHVISAAHCVVEKRGTRYRKLSTSSLVIYLGKNNIRSWAEEGQQAMEVEQITVHPEFNDRYKSDLSILLLTTAAKITRFVKPICLWDRNADLSLIVGQVGSVAGWGRDETGSITDKLRVAKMPVVSQETCLRSDSFYTMYTSNTTLCAGFRNGTTVCNGDSGGGLHFNMDNPTQGRHTWYLRGVVSVSMLDTSELRCDTRNYVVFTDVAKYTDWLKWQFRMIS